MYNLDILWYLTHYVLIYISILISLLYVYIRIGWFLTNFVCNYNKVLTNKVACSKKFIPIQTLVSTISGSDAIFKLFTLFG